MPLLMCGDTCSNMCNFCGCVGTACCPQGKEGCCSCFNNCCCFGPCCCEMCPCGSNGCLGYPNHLCGCCGNCNIMCYSDCCGPCMLADLHIATISDREEAAAEWSKVMCTITSLALLSQILSNMWPDGQSPEGGDEVVLMILSIVGDILGIVFGVYVTVIFGKAATAIAAKTGVTYEPAECCTRCCSDETCCAGCCPSMTCCLTYCCCGGCHALQVARSFEGSEELVSNIAEGRPEQCRCCNCWVQPGQGSAAADAQAV